MVVLSVLAHLFPVQVVAIILLALGGLLGRGIDWLGLGKARARVDAARAARQRGDAGSRLAPLRCPACGAVVPLVAAAEAPCRHCPGVVAVPEAYRALAELRAEATRDHAEAVRLLRLDRMVRSLRWRIGVAALLVVDVAAILHGANRGIIHQELFLFVPAVILANLFVALLVAVFAHEAPVRSLRPELVLPADRTGAEAPCAVCGAPLVVPPPSFVIATCLYCGADHLIGGRTSRRHAVVAARAEVAATTLLDATARVQGSLAGTARVFWAASVAIVGLTLLLGLQLVCVHALG